MEQKKHDNVSNCIVLLNMLEMERIESVDQFVFQVKSLVGGIINDNEVNNIWYRGEGDIYVKTPLIPKIYRIYNNIDNNHAFLNAKAIEKNLKAEFSLNARPYLQRSNIEQNNWNSYFLMQHYGLETRLLDWTESALIALFFSVENLSNESDGCVWLLNPFRLNKLATSYLKDDYNGTQVILNPFEKEEENLFNDEKLNLDELARMYLNLDFKIDENIDYYPLAISPPILDERMQMQASCFTIFGNQVNGLLGLNDYNSILKKVIINGGFKREIKEELRCLGVSNKFIYPGLEGISKSISDKYNNDHLILKRIK